VKIVRMSLALYGVIHVPDHSKKDYLTSLLRASTPSKEDVDSKDLFSERSWKHPPFNPLSEGRRLEDTTHNNTPYELGILKSMSDQVIQAGESLSFTLDSKELFKGASSIGVSLEDGSELPGWIKVENELRIVQKSNFPWESTSSAVSFVPYRNNPSGDNLFLVESGQITIVSASAFLSGEKRTLGTVPERKSLTVRGNTLVALHRNTNHDNTITPTFLSIVDVSNPSAPQTLGSWNLDAHIVYDCELLKIIFILFLGAHRATTYTVSTSVTPANPLMWQVLVQQVVERWTYMMIFLYCSGFSNLMANNISKYTISPEEG